MKWGNTSWRKKCSLQWKIILLICTSLNSFNDNSQTTLKLSWVVSLINITPIHDMLNMFYIYIILLCWIRKCGFIHHRLTIIARAWWKYFPISSLGTVIWMVTVWSPLLKITSTANFQWFVSWQINDIIYLISPSFLNTIFMLLFVNFVINYSNPFSLFKVSCFFTASVFPTVYL